MRRPVVPAAWKCRARCCDCSKLWPASMLAGHWCCLLYLSMPEHQDIRSTITSLHTLYLACKGTNIGIHLHVLVDGLRRLHHAARLTLVASEQAPTVIMSRSFWQSLTCPSTVLRMSDAADAMALHADMLGNPVGERPKRSTCQGQERACQPAVRHGLPLPVDCPGHLEPGAVPVAVLSTDLPCMSGGS